MPTYMLWYEEQQNGFAEALRRAAEYYHNRHGQWPTQVLAPQSWATEVAEVLERWKHLGKNGINIEVRQNVLPRHLMLTHQEIDESDE